MRALVSMRDALTDPHIFGDIMPGESWLGWRSLLIAAMGEELTDQERDIFRMLTGRQEEPLQRVEEFWAVVGRRGGKTRASAVLGVYFATLVDYSDTFAVGERGMLPFIAASQKQAEVAFGYAAGIIKHTPLLKGLVTNETEDSLSLSTRVDLQIRPANKRTARGPTYVAVIGDEAAFWHVEGAANADTEILQAVRPGLGTTHGPLIVISSPYARRGEVYKRWKRHYGTSGDPLILVAQGASRVLNPTLSQKIVDRALEDDEVSAKAEYLAQFRSDVEACLTIEAVEAVTQPKAFERPRLAGVRYFGFVDPSGGSADSMTLAIAHRDKDRIVLDAVREVKPPFSPESVVDEFAKTLKSYGISAVTGDKYAGEWAREPFRKRGIQYRPDASPRSDLYRDMIPLVNSGSVLLLDIPRLTSQLVALERRTSRGGRDSIDHPPGGHDDVANAVAGVLSIISEPAFASPMAMTGSYGRPGRYDDVATYGKGYGR